MKRSIRNWIAWAVIILISFIGIYKTVSLQGQVNLDDPAEIGNALGLVSLFPTLLAIILAFVWKNVVPSLLAGLLLGSALVTCLHADNVLYFFIRLFSGLKDTLFDPENLEVLILCLVIGGMIEVIRISGGFDSMGEKLIGKLNTRRRANLIAQLMGILVFFDDYATTLIVGPVMKPITDRLGISREKLAHIVDTTAGPVSAIALISSWVAVEITAIEDGLLEAGVQVHAYGILIAAIPFTFYCLFALILLFLSSLTGREIGPMKQAEERALAGQPLKADSKVKKSSKPDNHDRRKASMIIAVLPVIILFVYSLVGFYVSGYQNSLAQGIISGNEPFSMELLSHIFGNADAILMILEGTILATIVAFVIGLSQKAFRLEEAVKGFGRGCYGIVETIEILLMAWTMTAFIEQLGAIQYAVKMITGNIAWWLIPTLIFLVSCLISSAVGSFGLMFMVIPISVPTAIHMMNALPQINGNYLALCVGCGIAGGVFGDHLSPITDCTVLSTQATECNNFDHVMTQLPYGLITLLISVCAGILPATYGLPAILCLLIGSSAMLLILYIFGRVPKNIKEN